MSKGDDPATWSNKCILPPKYTHLLMTTLNRAITAIQSDGIAIFVGKQLHLQVTGPRRQLHDEDGTSWNLPAHLPVRRLNILGTVDHANALAAATLRGLDHDGKTNLLGSFQRLGGAADGSRLVGAVGETAGLPIVLGPDVLAVPGDAGHAGRLRDDGAADLVAEGAHGRSRRADELDGRAGLGQRVGEGGILAGMAPAGPNGVDAVQPRELDDERYVGVVVIVRAARHVDDDVSHANVLRVGTVCVDSS